MNQPGLDKDRTPDRLDVIADEIQTLGSGVIGLTIACARCHSHKFDPIPQREYYALSAVLKGAYDEHDWLIPNQRRLPHVSTRERREWEAHGKRLQSEIESLRASLKENAAASKRSWSMKAMHRLIMSSSVYRQSSVTALEGQRLDPANDLLSHFPLKRMEAEALADTLLLVAGRLDESRFGLPDNVQVRGDGLVTAVGTNKGWRRGIYVRQRRKEIPTILETFDLPQMNPNCLSHWNSVVPTQALHLMNNGMIHELADSLAARVVAESGHAPTNQIRRLYRIALNRLPTPEEEQLDLATLGQLAAKWAEPSRASKLTEPEPARRALANLCHAIINSAEFMFID